MSELFLRLRERYQREGGAWAEPILKLNWPYKVADEPSPEEIAKEFNGYVTADFTDASGMAFKAGQQLSGFLSSGTTVAPPRAAGSSAAVGPSKATRWPGVTTAILMA